MANPTQGVQNFTVPYTDTIRKWPIKAGATTYYVGEMFGKNAAGNVTHFDDTVRMYLVGIQANSVPIPVDSADLAGDNTADLERPFLFSAKIASAAAGDEGKKVFALYSDTVQYANGTYSNLAGTVFLVIDSTHVLIAPPWSPFHGTGSLPGYFTANAAAGTTLDAMDAGKLIICPLTAGETVTLPPVANCSPGDKFTFLNTTANSSLLTIAGNASENINGANTFSAGATQYAFTELVTDGTAWYASILPAGTTSFTSTATFSDAINIVFNTTTGTKIGTGTTQKIGFWNATPIVQPANTVDYLAGLVNAGLRASGGTAAAAFPGLVSATSMTCTGRVLATLLAVGPAPTDTYGAAMTIDVTKSLHVVSAANGTSAACTMTPSAAGSAGDIMTIITEADGSGTVTVTFASTFHSSGTQATTLSKFSSIVFQSDGTRWVEICRSTALT